jgi:hypothetical protein
MRASTPAQCVAIPSGYSLGGSAAKSTTSSRPEATRSAVAMRKGRLLESRCSSTTLYPAFSSALMGTRPVTRGRGGVTPLANRHRASLRRPKDGRTTGAWCLGRAGLRRTQQSGALWRHTWVGHPHSVRTLCIGHRATLWKSCPRNGPCSVPEGFTDSGGRSQCAMYPRSDKSAATAHVLTFSSGTTVPPLVTTAMLPGCLAKNAPSSSRAATARCRRAAAGTVESRQGKGAQRVGKVRQSRGLHAQTLQCMVNTTGSRRLRGGGQGSRKRR